MIITAEEFKKHTGHEPEMDDLERVNCPKVGEIGHQQCGWCENCNSPKFQCFCEDKSL